MKKLNFESSTLRYSGIIGTGGIGSGKFFMLNQNHTLGREESRSGHFLDIRDYCKQHIILHYIKILLGPSFLVIPVGKIGDDDIGVRLYGEMSETGLIMDYVKKEAGVSTLFSFCFCYPDGSGGNMSTDDSASARVSPVFIEKVAGRIRQLGNKGMILAAPEVPVDARHRLLILGKEHGLFTAASFTSEEINFAFKDNLMPLIDLLAINLDEACSLTEISFRVEKTENIVRSAVRKLQMGNPNIIVSITAGDNGSWCWDGRVLKFVQAARIKPVSTAGAGDAFFSGLLTGLALNLRLEESQELATLVAGLSVTSSDTINKNIDRKSLDDFSRVSGLTISDNIYKLLER